MESTNNYNGLFKKKVGRPKKSQLAFNELRNSIKTEDQFSMLHNPFEEDVEGFTGYKFDNPESDMKFIKSEDLFKPLIKEDDFELDDDSPKET